MTDSRAGKFQVEHREMSPNGEQNAHVAFLPTLHDTAAKALVEVNRINGAYVDEVNSLTPVQHKAWTERWQSYWQVVEAVVPAGVWIVERYVADPKEAIRAQLQLEYGFASTEAEAQEVCDLLTRKLEATRRQIYAVAESRTGRWSLGAWGVNGKPQRTFQEWYKLLPQVEYRPLRLASVAELRADPEHAELFQVEETP